MPWTRASASRWRHSFLCILWAVLRRCIRPSSDRARRPQCHSTRCARGAFSKSPNHGARDDMLGVMRGVRPDKSVVLAVPGILLSAVQLLLPPAAPGSDRAMPYPRRRTWSTKDTCAQMESVEWLLSPSCRPHPGFAYACGRKEFWAGLNGDGLTTSCRCQYSSSSGDAHRTEDEHLTPL